MFEKISRVLIIVLLAGILGVLVYDQVKTPGPSEDCLQAILDANLLITTMKGEVADTLVQYQTSAYENAKNINQQIFKANEYSLLSITLTAQYTEAILKVQTACR